MSTTRFAPLPPLRETLATMPSIAVKTNALPAVGATLRTTGWPGNGSATKARSDKENNDEQKAHENLATAQYRSSLSSVRLPEAFRTRNARQCWTAFGRTGNSKRNQTIGHGNPRS